MIKVSGLNKFYNKNKANEIHVINDVSFELPSTGLVAFLGASGSGKTTLLNVIGGLDKAKGKIAYDSFEMKDYDSRRIDEFRNENFGYVFQGYNLLLDESVYENLRVALELINIHDEREIAARIEYALKSVGMYKYRNKRAGRLSGGQQQRVAIARALVKHCKLIIADEPTGNLDSANAVEIMNILKSISKKTLVLLVTHNEPLASFYSDKIYKIEDGRIADGYENSGSASLNAANDNVFYLRDMKLDECVSDKISVKLYSDGEKSIDLEIVERNNTFYLRSSKTIKLIDSSVTLIDGSYKPIEKKEIDDHGYDDSFFNNSLKKKSAIRDALMSFKRAFLSFIKPTKKVKTLYISLALIGIVFALCTISVANATSVNASNISADDNYSTLDNMGEYIFEDTSEILKKGLISGEISSVQILYYRYTYFTKRINYVEEKEYSNSFRQIYYNKDVNTLLSGRAPMGDEIAISSGLADFLLTELECTSESYDELYSISCDGGDSVLVGIVDNPYKIIYVGEAAYIENVTSGAFVKCDVYRYYSCEKKYDTYEIVAGRDLGDSDLGTGNILISEKYPYAENMIGEDIAGLGEVVGIYRMKNFGEGSGEVIVNAHYEPTLTGSYKFSYSVEDYHLVEGREPMRESECLISIYSGMEIGDTFDGYEIVGRYNSNIEPLYANVLLSTSALSIDEYSQKAFVVENEADFIDTVNGEFELMSLFMAEYNWQGRENEERMLVFSILGTVCLLAGSIMVYFLMRSKMLRDIYNIGVYRSLGASKKKIYLKYLADTLVMITFTALVTYALIMIGYLTAIESINSYFYLDLYSKGLVFPLLGAAALYTVSTVFGLLPIFMLLRNTPSEIIAKYDI